MSTATVELVDVDLDVEHTEPCQAPVSPGVRCGKDATWRVVRRCPCGTLRRSSRCEAHAAQLRDHVRLGLVECTSCGGTVEPADVAWYRL